MTNPRVIYIVGTSFSGSTVLGALLGMHPNSLCAGELSNWTLYHSSSEVPCSCGLNWQECPFWRQVRRLWLERDHPGWSAYKQLQRRYERMRSVPVLALQQRLQRTDFSRYADATRRIYQILGEVSEKKVIFDISKKVGRAQTLSRIGGLDIGYIHLIRDGRGYYISAIKHMRKHPLEGQKSTSLTRLLLRSTLEWMMINRMAEKAIQASGFPALRLRYEDLALDPGKALADIAKTFSMDMNAVRAGLENGVRVDFGHMWGGNEVRLAGPVKLGLNESWKHQISPSASRLFWALAGSTARHYGYARQEMTQP